VLNRARLSFQAKQIFWNFGNFKWLGVSTTIDGCEVLPLAAHALYARSLIKVEINSVAAYQGRFRPFGHRSPFAVAGMILGGQSFSNR
jgi:hypothetical protein